MIERRWWRGPVTAMAAGVVTLILLAGCGGTPPRGDASAGSRLYFTRCRSCHSPYDPASKTVAWWQGNLDRYAQRAHLTSAERDSVMAFVIRTVHADPVP